MESLTNFIITIFGILFTYVFLFGAGLCMYMFAAGDLYAALNFLITAILGYYLHSFTLYIEQKRLYRKGKK